MKQMLCGLVLVVVVGTLQVFAADIKVDNNSDSGPGSLRDAILRANASGGGIIRFLKKDSGTILLQSPLPALTRNITVIGPGSDQLTIQRDVNSTSQLDGF